VSISEISGFEKPAYLSEYNSANRNPCGKKGDYSPRRARSIGSFLHLLDALFRHDLVSEFLRLVLTSLPCIP